MDDLVVWRSNNFFWVAVFSLVGLKLYLVSGGAVQMIYAPHDDGLYVSRAFHLLTDGTLGPYDSRLLVKELGLSLWLAGARVLGLPYLFLINIVRPEIILNAATIIIKVSIINITFLSTLRALKKDLFKSAQV